MKVRQCGKFQELWKFLQVQSQKPSRVMMKLSLMRTTTGKEDYRKGRPRITSAAEHKFIRVTRHISLTPSFSAATSDLGQQHQCNSIASAPLLTRTWARTRDPLHTDNSHPQSIVIHRSTNPQTLQSKGNNYFKVSEWVTSPIETLLSRTLLTS